MIVIIIRHRRGRIVVEHRGVVALRGLRGSMVDHAAVRCRNRGHAEHPEQSEQQHPSDQNDLHDAHIDLRKEIIIPSQPEEQRKKQHGKEQVQQNVVRLILHDFKRDVGSLKHRGLQKTHDGDVTERDKGEHAEYGDDDRFQFGRFLQGRRHNGLSSHLRSPAVQIPA